MPTCTWVCPPNCGGEHHPLLIALFNIVDADTLAHFTGIMTSFQVTGFNLEMNIPDPNPSFRHSLVHWAAVLGKADVLNVLQQPPFSVDMELQSDDFSTALHRCMLLWNSKDITLSNAVAVVEELHECVGRRNSQQLTPLHLCALNLTQCVKPDTFFWKEIMNKMVMVIDDSRLLDGLNCQNADGDTILHILSANDDLLDLINSLLCYGANFNIVNKRQEKPIDIAWNFSIAVYNLYKVITTEIGLDEFYANKNVRRTRTATGLSKTKKDYKKFFDDSDEKSDDEDYVITKRKSNPQLSKSHEPCKKARPDKDFANENNGKVERHPKRCSSATALKRQAVENVASSTPAPASPSPCFNGVYLKLQQDELRLEKEISETMRSIIAMFPDAAAYPK